MVFTNGEVAAVAMAADHVLALDFGQPECTSDDALAAVQFISATPGCSASDVHENWRSSKLALGWALPNADDAFAVENAARVSMGLDPMPAPDGAVNTDPNLLPWDQLSDQLQARGSLFTAVCKSLLGG